MMKILVVDRDSSICESVKSGLENLGYAVVTAGNYDGAIKAIKKETPEVLLTDMNLGEGSRSGIDLIKEMKNQPIYKIMMAGECSHSVVFEAAKKGAYEFLSKPVCFKILQELIFRIYEEKKIQDKNTSLKQKNDILQEAAEIRTKNDKMKRSVESAKKIAKVECPVLITGESGTGKSYIAKLIHKESLRENKAFVVVNCATLRDNLLENELFGSVKDSFSGALKEKVGRLELADGGTIFLDEIGEASPGVQAKILRFLQDGEFERVGENEIRRVNVRIITATCKNLEKEAKEGRFREDLYYRLNVAEIQMPTLKERPEDIIDLANAYIGRAFIVNGSEPKPFSVEAKMILQKYIWPGNVRELQNALERAAVICAGDVVQVCDLPDRIVLKVEENGGNPTSPTNAVSLDYMEKEHIKRVLAVANTLEEAASILGINMSTLWRKRKKYELE